MSTIDHATTHPFMARSKLVRTPNKSSVVDVSAKMNPFPTRSKLMRTPPIAPKNENTNTGAAMAHMNKPKIITTKPQGSPIQKAVTFNPNPTGRGLLRTPPIALSRPTSRTPLQPVRSSPAASPRIQPLRHSPAQSRPTRHSPVAVPRLPTGRDSPVIISPKVKYHEKTNLSRTPPIPVFRQKATTPVVRGPTIPSGKGLARTPIYQSKPENIVPKGRSLARTPPDAALSKPETKPVVETKSDENIEIKESKENVVEKVIEEASIEATLQQAADNANADSIVNEPSNEVPSSPEVEIKSPPKKGPSPNKNAILQSPLSAPRLVRIATNTTGERIRAKVPVLAASSPLSRHVMNAKTSFARAPTPRRFVAVSPEAEENTESEGSSVSPSVHHSPFQPIRTLQRTPPEVEQKEPEVDDDEEIEMDIPSEKSTLDMEESSTYHSASPGHSNPAMPDLGSPLLVISKKSFDKQESSPFANDDNPFSVIETARPPSATHSTDAPTSLVASMVAPSPVRDEKSLLSQESESLHHQELEYESAELVVSPAARSRTVRHLLSPVLSEMDNEGLDSENLLETVTQSDVSEPTETLPPMPSWLANCVRPPVATSRLIPPKMVIIAQPSQQNFATPAKQSTLIPVTEAQLESSVPTSPLVSFNDVDIEKQQDMFVPNASELSDSAFDHEKQMEEPLEVMPTFEEEIQVQSVAPVRTQTETVVKQIRPPKAIKKPTIAARPLTEAEKSWKEHCRNYSNVQEQQTKLQHDFDALEVEAVALTQQLDAASMTLFDRDDSTCEQNKNKLDQTQWIQSKLMRVSARDPQRAQTLRQSLALWAAQRQELLDRETELQSIFLRLAQDRIQLTQRHEEIIPVAAPELIVNHEDTSSLAPQVYPETAALMARAEQMLARQRLLQETQYLT